MYSILIKSLITFGIAWIAASPMASALLHGWLKSLKTCHTVA
ncbi:MULTISPECIES: hypothetical protein [unclassified Rickettsia]